MLNAVDVVALFVGLVIVAVLGVCGVIQQIIKRKKAKAERERLKKERADETFASLQKFRKELEERQAEERNTAPVLWPDRPPKQRKRLVNLWASNGPVDPEHTGLWDMIPMTDIEYDHYLSTGEIIKMN